LGDFFAVICVSVTVSVSGSGSVSRPLAKVLSTITTISWSWSICWISWSNRLAYSYHLNLFNLFKGDLNGFASGFFLVVAIVVFADLLRNNFSGFGTDGTDHNVGERVFDDDFDGQSSFAARG